MTKSTTEDDSEEELEDTYHCYMRLKAKSSVLTKLQSDICTCWIPYLTNLTEVNTYQLFRARKAVQTWERH